MPDTRHEGEALLQLWSAAVIGACRETIEEAVQVRATLTNPIAIARCDALIEQARQILASATLARKVIDGAAERTHA